MDYRCKLGGAAVQGDCCPNKRGRAGVPHAGSLDLVIHPYKKAVPKKPEQLLLS